MINYHIKCNDSLVSTCTLMDNTMSFSSSLESTGALSAMIEAVSSACDALVDVFAISFEKVSEYGVRSLQGVFSGTRFLFVDVILQGLKKIELSVQELKTKGSDLGCSSDQIQDITAFFHSQLEKKLQHKFFADTFGWKVNQIFA